nr:MAG TPA: RalF C-terminal Sec-7 capping domain [Caudoviricetes sp.]
MKSFPVVRALNLPSETEKWLFGKQPVKRNMRPL